MTEILFTFNANDLKHANEANYSVCTVFFHILKNTVHKCNI